MKLLNKIKNIIKAGILLSTLDEKRVQIETLGKKQSALLLQPYGLEINPPVDNILCVLLSESGNEDSMIAIPFDIDKIATTKIIIENDNKIIFVVDGKEGGDFMARFNELKSGFDQLKSDFNSFITTAYNTHVHSGVTTGPGFSGPGAPLGSSSAASIDSAKIDNIEVPGL